MLEEIQPQKTKVLVLADYCCTTGFATVASNIMRELHATGRYIIDVVGINFTGDPYDTNLYPGNVWPAMNIANMGANDPYGRQRFLDMLGTGIYDVAFVLTDTFIMQTFIDAVIDTQTALPKKFKFIYYFPIDCTPKREWIEACVVKADYPVVYTEYGRRLVLDISPELEGKLNVIYHGTNINEFNYIEDRKKVEDFRQRYFAGKAKDKFVITNVNRNQPRKDVIRSFMVLNELRRRGRDNAVLYMHMANDDAGGNIMVMSDHFGFKLQEDFILPSPSIFTVNRGLSIEAMNFIYNASDAVLTTTLGEGWGLSITEAMATKTPVIAPDNTSISEILADNRGLLVKSGSTTSEWCCLGGMDNERIRPLMNVDDAATKIEAVMDGNLPDIDNAYEWAQKYNWNSVCKEWVRIFDAAAFSAKQATDLAANANKPNRAQRRQMAKLNKNKSRRK